VQSLVPKSLVSVLLLPGVVSVLLPGVAALEDSDASSSQLYDCDAPSSQLEDPDA
jgi:hypothetical protein